MTDSVVVRRSEPLRVLFDDVDSSIYQSPLPPPGRDLLPVDKAESSIGKSVISMSTEDSSTPKLAEGGISETMDETQKEVDWLTKDFELKVRSASEAKVDVHQPIYSDDDDGMNEYPMDQTIHSNDDEEWLDEFENVCQVCLKEKEHRTILCPFLDRIPDPKNTKLGPEYMIVCKCCHRDDAHSDDDDDWEGEAVFDPLAMMFIPKDPNEDPRALITDLRNYDTLKSKLENDPEFRWRFKGQ